MERIQKSILFNSKIIIHTKIETKQPGERLSEYAIMNNV